MSHAYIVAPLRTPVGKFGGALSALKADQLAAHIERLAEPGARDGDVS